MSQGTLPPQAVQIRCQSCQTPFNAPVWSYIDVGVQPELKAGLMSGQINMAVCPNCGLGGMLATPLAYHDPAKKLFLILIPQELNLAQAEQEQFVGEVTRLAMTTLPDDAPKGHLLTPRNFFSMQSLLETVMEGEGISKEVMQAQQARVTLLSELADAYETDKATPPADLHSGALAKVVEQRKDAIDYEFFLTLNTYMEAAQQQGREDSITVLSDLYTALIELTGFDAVKAGLVAPDAQTIIDAFLAADESDLDALVSHYRPAMDDDLWDAWETYASDLDSDHAAQALARRDAVSATVQGMDEEAQAIFEAAVALLRRAMESQDPKALLSEHRTQLNEAFMLVIEANVSAALRSGQEDVAQQLVHLRNLAVDVIEEAMTPQDRLVNQLLTAETSADAKKILRKNMGQVNQELVQLFNSMIEQMEQSGQKDSASRLQDMAREAASLLF